MKRGGAYFNPSKKKSFSHTINKHPPIDKHQRIDKRSRIVVKQGKTKKDEKRERVDVSYKGDKDLFVKKGSKHEL